MGSLSPTMSSSRGLDLQKKTSTSNNSLERNSGCYDTNSLRLITPRLCTYNVNVNRPYTHVNNINRMFMVDLTYMPGYFIETEPHPNYKNRAASWSPGNRPVALPPGLSKAGQEEKQELEAFTKKQRENDPTNDARANIIGNTPIRFDPPALGLLKGLYKRPLTMYDLNEDDLTTLKPSCRKSFQPKNRYKIFPELIPVNGENLNERRFDVNYYKKQQNNLTAGREWNMDRFMMWSGGTEGSVEFPTWEKQTSWKEL